MLRNEHGEWVEDEDLLRGMVNNFYQQLFDEEGIPCQWSRTKFSYPTIEDQIRRDLANPISMMEVRRAVFSMGPWKAPGPDRFPAGFFQKSWDVVGVVVFDYVDHIWRHPHDIAAVNQTDICLIPKVDKPQFVSQFCPISLCNSIYKIVTKTIVFRLKLIIADLVSPFQTGFVPRRNIHENIVIVQEMMHSMNKI